MPDELTKTESKNISRTIQVRKRILDDAVIEELWRLYLECYKKNLENYIQEQRCYTFNTFKEALEDPEYIKFILLINGKPVGLLIGTNNLQKASIAYINPIAFEYRFPLMYREKKIFYVTFLGIIHENQSVANIVRLLKFVASYCAKEKLFLAFDFAYSQNKKLPSVIMRIVKDLVKNGKIDISNPKYIKLDHQEYGIITFDNDLNN